MGVIAALTVAVLLFARVGALHGKKVTLYVVTEGATGVLLGTEVWMAGEREGVVKEITFRPPTAPQNERVLIRTEFLESAMPNVRRDSYSQIRPSSGLVGASIVYIAPGTSLAAPLRAGDTVHTRPKAVSRLAADVGKIGPEFAALGAATKDLSNKITRPVGTIGNYRTNGLPDLPDVQAGMSSLNSRARGNGTIGRAMRGDLRLRASRAIASADSIKTLLASNRGTLGRFSRDSTLVTKAGHVLAEVDSLRALFGNPLGAIGGSHPDSALTLELARTHTLLASLIADAKKNPLRYIRF